MSGGARSPLDLLAPGALLGGPLFESLVDTIGAAGQLAPGTRLGPFRIGTELGRGGMGVVYRAERDDGEYDQVVAIKSLGATGNEKGLELFRRERQVLAELKHPHIARLLDGGHHVDGRLWFAMELVDGHPIDAHARRAHLSVPERLRLFRQVVDAVAFAHQRLLIHRDLKPGNVLVDADGSVKLLDFGIAALVGDAEATRAYSPGWASPEQWAAADVGPASDQYQLGLLLDALLFDVESPSSGQTSSDSTDGTRATIAQSAAAIPGRADPASARRIAPARWLPMPQSRKLELIAIASRATAPTPDARYGSVAELGAEIDRFLALQPVVAREGGLSYTLRCAVRRHPAVATGVFAATLGLIVLVTLFNARLSAERDVARAAAARAEATRDFLVGLFRDGDPTRGSDPDLSARALIQAGVLRIESDRTLPPDVRADLMQLLADIQLRLGDSEHATALLARLDRSTLDAGTLAEMEGRLASLLGKPKDAVTHFAAAVTHGDTPERQLLLARAENDAGEGARAAMRLDAMLAAPDALPDALAASAWLSRGVQRWREGDPNGALGAYDRALERAATADTPMSPIALHINRGLALVDLARLDEALAEFATAEAELSRFPNFKYQGLILQNRGMALLRQGDVEAAKAAWSQLLDLSDDGANPGLEASTVHNLASAADRQNDPVGSMRYSLRAEALRTQLGDAPAALSSRINVIAKLYAVGHAEAGMQLAADAAAQADAMQRPDLAARARLTGATSRCIVEPDACVASLESVATLFEQQDNRVKLQETLDKLVIAAFEHHDDDALARALPRYEASMQSGDKADAAKPDERIAVFRAMAAHDLGALAQRAADDETARRALVLLAIERGDPGTAATEFAQLPPEPSDRYWTLAERVAVLKGDRVAASRARNARARLAGDVRALFVDTAYSKLFENSASPSDVTASAAGADTLGR